MSSPDNIDTVLSADRLESIVSTLIKSRPYDLPLELPYQLSHTLQPSQSRLTEDRVFIPRTCSICREEPTVPATALLVCDWEARNLDRLFRTICEKGRSETAPGSERRETEGRSWRSALGAPRMVRRENIVATEVDAREEGLGGALPHVSRLLGARIGNVEAALMRCSGFLFLCERLLLGASVSPSIRGCGVDWWVAGPCNSLRNEFDY